MEKEIETSLRKVKVREAKYVEFAGMNLDPNDKVGIAKKTLKIATDLTDQEIDNLGLRDGTLLMNAFNELNGLTGFQKLS